MQLGKYGNKVVIKVSKNGTLPGLRPLQIGIGSHRDRFWTFSRWEQKSQPNRRYGRYGTPLRARNAVTAANSFSSTLKVTNLWGRRSEQPPERENREEEEDGAVLKTAEGKDEAVLALGTWKEKTKRCQAFLLFLFSMKKTIKKLGIGEANYPPRDLIRYTTLQI
jgi:hypothetical protein